MVNMKWEQIYTHCSYHSSKMSTLFSITALLKHASRPTPETNRAVCMTAVFVSAVTRVRSKMGLNSDLQDLLMVSDNLTNSCIFAAIGLFLQHSAVFKRLPVLDCLIYNSGYL